MSGRHTTREILGFNDWVFMLVGMPVLSLILPFILPGNMNVASWDIYPLKAASSFVFVLVYWSLTRAYTIFIRRRMPDHHQTGKRIVYTGIFVLVLVVSLSLICKPYLKGFFQKLYNDPTVEVNPLGMALVSLVLCSAVLGIYETMFAVNRWKGTLVEAEKLRRENVQAQLDTLRSQVNPHFLFNSLNTLTSLVHDNPDLSVEFIQKLSRTYRYVLEIRDKELIPLAEEMECVHAYLFLLHTRFGENLKVNLSIPAEAEKLYLAPLSLQLLIENAIKHNVVSSRKPLQIHIEVKDGDKLMVRNNLQKKDQEQTGTRSGLENIRNRYALLVKREIVVEETAESFTVILPLIKLERYAPDHH